MQRICWIVLVLCTTAMFGQNTVTQTANLPTAHSSAKNEVTEIPFAGLVGGGGTSPDGQQHGQGLATAGLYDIQDHLGFLLEVGAVKRSTERDIAVFGSANFVSAWRLPNLKNDYIFATVGVTGGEIGPLNYGAGWDHHFDRRGEAALGHAVRFEVRNYASGHSHDLAFRVGWLFGHN